MVIKVNAAQRLKAYDNTWIHKLKQHKQAHPKYEGQQKPKQLEDEKIFNMQPSQLSQELQKIYKDDYEGAMGSLTLYKNRMGKQLKTPDQDRIDKAKDELKKRYGRDDENQTERKPATGPKQKSSKPIGSKPTGKIV